MKTSKKLKLLEDSFTEDEAREILTGLYHSRINFLNIKNWMSRERNGNEDEDAQQLLPILRSELKNLQNILDEAKLRNKRLRVSSEITIAFSED